MENQTADLVSRDLLVSAVVEMRKANGRSFKKRLKTLRLLIGYLKTVASQAETDENICRQIVDSFDEFPRLIGEALVTFVQLVDDHEGLKNVLDLGAEFSDVLESTLSSLKQWCDGDTASRPALTSITMPLLNEMLRVCSENPRDWQYVIVVGTPLAFLLWDMENYDQSVIKDWSLEVLPFIRKLVQALVVVGDFSCQYRVVVLLLQWLPKIDRDIGEKLVEKCFHMMDSLDRDILFRSTGDQDFDDVARKFLAALNSNPIVMKKTPVISVPCDYFFAGQEQLSTPRSNEKYWVDFSIKSRRIHVFFAVPEIDWMDLNISVDSIESTCVTWARRKDGHDFNVPDLCTQSSCLSSGVTGMATSVMCFLHIVLKQEFSSLTCELQRFSTNESRSLIFAFFDVASIEDTLEKMKLPVHNHDKKVCSLPKGLMQLIRGDDSSKAEEIPGASVKDEPMSPSPVDESFIPPPSSTSEENLCYTLGSSRGSVKQDPCTQNWTSETPVKSRFISEGVEQQLESPEAPESDFSDCEEDEVEVEEKVLLRPLPLTPMPPRLTARPPTPRCPSFISPSPSQLTYDSRVPQRLDDTSFDSRQTEDEVEEEEKVLVRPLPTTPMPQRLTPRPPTPRGPSLISPSPSQLTCDSRVPQSLDDTSFDSRQKEDEVEVEEEEKELVRTLPITAMSQRLTQRPPTPRCPSLISPSPSQLTCDSRVPKRLDGTSFDSRQKDESITVPPGFSTAKSLQNSVDDEDSVGSYVPESPPPPGLNILAGTSQNGIQLTIDSEINLYSQLEEEASIEKVTNSKLNSTNRGNRQLGFKTKAATSVTENRTMPRREFKKPRRRNVNEVQCVVPMRVRSSVPKVLGRTPCYAQENLAKLEKTRSQLLEEHLGASLTQFVDPYEFSKSWDFLNGKTMRTYSSKKKRPLNQKRRGSSSRKRSVINHDHDEDDDLDQLLAKLPARDKTLGDKRITGRGRKK